MSNPRYRYIGAQSQAILLERQRREQRLALERLRRQRSERQRGAAAHPTITPDERTLSHDTDKYRIV